MADTAPIKPTGSPLSHPLMGASVATLYRLARKYGGPGPGARTKYALMALSALGRLPFSAIEALVVASKRKRDVPINPPVFIVGHWRSGTTHLYNIMAKAPRFAFVNPFQTGLPWDFLTLTKLFRPLLVKTLPDGRYIDQVPVTPDSPQEDEFALANMMETSFLDALYFPKDFRTTFNRGLFFDGADDEEIAEWWVKVKYFYLKLQIAAPAKRILVKNPPYTARIGFLADMFPDARFIHIHRNPYKVFFSMRNFYEQLLAELALQPYSLEGIDDHIFETFSRMMEALEEDSKTLPKNRFISMAFHDLQEKPMEALKKVYTQLDLAGFDEDQTHFEAYLKGITGYKKNVYDYPEKDLKKVEKHWRKFIKAGGYKRP